jgi:hypothetical protein
MKLSIIVDATGRVVGAAHQGAAVKGAEAAQAGLAAGPGQSIQEVEVPDEVAKLQGDELLARLSGDNEVKQALSTQIAAGLVR